MPEAQTKQATSVDFIRLWFKDPVEEEIAHRWAARLAGVVGPQASQLRPDTTLDEMLTWASCCDADSMDFVVVFEPELRLELKYFLDRADDVTFREMVQHYAQRFGN